MTTYTYDALQRLTSADYPSVSAITYTYDKVGNRLSVSSPSTTYVYDEADQLKSISGTNNSHDKNGNLRNIGTNGNNSFIYDNDNRMVREDSCRGDIDATGDVDSADQGAFASHYSGTTVYEGGGAFDILVDLNSDQQLNSGDQGPMAAEFNKQCKSTGPSTGNGRYWYNGDGLRIGSRNFSTTAPTQVETSYVWDAGAGMPSVLQETRVPNSGATVTTTYLYGLDLIATTVGSGASVFYLADGLGSTRELTTANGDVVDGYHYTYDVWGGLRSAQPATANDFRFTGEQTDVRANRGLVYLRARFYDPALGRFLNRDPLPIGNRYAYVGNSPSNFTDPSGLCCFHGLPTIPVPNIPLPDPRELVEDTVDYGKDVAGCATRYGVQYCPGLVLFDRIATAVACKIDKENYFDFSAAYPSGGQVVGGVQFSCKQGAHPYLGIGAGPVQGGGASFAPNQTITEGPQCGVTFSPIGPQIGLSRTGLFYEFGPFFGGSVGSCYFVGPRP